VPGVRADRTGPAARQQVAPTPPRLGGTEPHRSRIRNGSNRIKCAFDAVLPGPRRGAGWGPGPWEWCRCGVAAHEGREWRGRCRANANEGGPVRWASAAGLPRRPAGELPGIWKNAGRAAGSGRQRRARRPRKLAGRWHPWRGDPVSPHRPAPARRAQTPDDRAALFRSGRFLPPRFGNNPANFQLRPGRRAAHLGLLESDQGVPGEKQ
jgi:hypothetical protein